jgi:hypothetical protein
MRERRKHSRKSNGRSARFHVHRVHSNQKFPGKALVLNLTDSRPVDVPEASLGYVSQARIGRLGVARCEEQG